VNALAATAATLITFGALAAPASGQSVRACEVLDRFLTGRGNASAEAVARLAWECPARGVDVLLRLWEDASSANVAPALLAEHSRLLRDRRLTDRLAAIARDPSRSADLRVEALRALAGQVARGALVYDADLVPPPEPWGLIETRVLYRGHATIVDGPLPLGTGDISRVKDLFTAWADNTEPDTRVRFAAWYLRRLIAGFEK
jgi:hypothetical protein